MDERVPEHRDSHASSSHEVSLEPTITSRKTEIASSARGPKSQGPRAEDAVAEPHFVQKILMT